MLFHSVGSWIENENTDDAKIHTASAISTRGAARR